MNTAGTNKGKETSGQLKDGDENCDSELRLFKKIYLLTHVYVCLLALVYTQYVHERACGDLKMALDAQILS